MNEISKAAAKKDIVEAAEAHAKKLQNISEDLEKYDVEQIPNFIITLRDLSQFILSMISLLVLCVIKHEMSTFSASIHIFFYPFSAVKNASGLSEVRSARDAIDAYKNITDAINAAEAAANEAAAAAGNALNVSQRFAN